ncbi:MAG: NAD-dependent epimerase/dehydratase family protein [Acidobacteriota bacterium]|nr:NAD-dependent epimerase/dehydratase family protein [Acidobacteriota bacterium]
MATYLVTGGAGFIGSHLVEALVARGEKVRVVDSLVTGRRENLGQVAGVDLTVGDLADSAVADHVVKGIDYVVHLAATPSVSRSIEDPIGSHKDNVAVTLSLLSAAKRHRVRRVVFASSSAIYGNTATVPSGEDLKPDPLSPYALQKLIGEQYGKLFQKLYGLDTVVLRYFNVFGPRQDSFSPYSGVISIFSRCLIEGRQPVIYGDGEQTRDFTYVDNVIDGTLRACTAPKASGEVINVSCGDRVTLNVLFELMRQFSGVEVRPKFAELRPGEVRHSQADISRAKALLGYQPVVAFREGLRRTIEWYQAQVV